MVLIKQILRANLSSNRLDHWFFEILIFSNLRRHSYFYKIYPIDCRLWDWDIQYPP